MAINHPAKERKASPGQRQAPPEKEFVLSRGEFDNLRQRVSSLTGIVLKDNKYDMVYSRLVRRVRELELADFRNYLDYLDGDHGEEELVNFVNAITTNLTHFFREAHHFQHIRQELLKPICEAARRGGGTKKIRIWSAGCSTGQEPYSIAMTARAALSEREGFDIKILASDVDTSVLDKARRGVYSVETLEGIPDSLAKRFTTKKSDDQFEIAAKIKEMISFKQLNLMEKWPHKGPFDAIMCRNVMIYFDRPTQHKLIGRYFDLLRPGGFLYIGHSESMAVVNKNLKPLGKSTFMKVE